MLDWLIVGGGIHGTLIAATLRREAGVAADRIRILDPHRRPMARWRELTRNVGMKHLRSPAAHHMGGAAFSLRSFAVRRGAGDALLGAYLRPTLELFDAHAEEVCRRQRLAELRLRGTAVRIRRSRRSLLVETTNGLLECRRLLLAVGPTAPAAWPAWARELKRKGGRVHHLYDPGFRRRDLEPASSSLIVGGGLSAAELALHLEDSGAPATILSRHPPRIHQFDSDPSWLGPKRLRAFWRETRPERRRRLIERARHGGSMPPDVAARIEAARREGRLRWLCGEVLDAEAGAPMLLETGEEELRPELVLLATGFEDQCPRDSALRESIEELGLPCSSCGFPILSPSLEWAPGLHVCGSLAELELGPLARNISGAVLAASRLKGIAG